MFVERSQLLSGLCVPHFAGAIVGSSDELTSVFVEGAVSQREQVSAKYFEKTEALLLVLLLLLNKLFDEFLKLGLAGFRDEWLLKKDLVDQAINVSSIRYSELVTLFAEFLALDHINMMR